LALIKQKGQHTVTEWREYEQHKTKSVYGNNAPHNKWNNTLRWQQWPRGGTSKKMGHALFCFKRWG
jgi:hypothetical protein